MICFAWGGFPQYAARLVGAFVDAVEGGKIEAFKGERIVVAAKPPAVPVRGMESCTHCEIKWVQPEDVVSLRELFGEVPRRLLVSGWCYPSFNRFRDEVLANGGRVIVTCDNNFELRDTRLGRLLDYGGWGKWAREYAKLLRFRFLLKKYYSGFLVPGKSGQRMMRYYGVSPSEVSTGLYAADASVFHCDVPILSRPKRFIYVGQYVERKNVRRLCQAFQNAEDSVRGGWTLDLFGSGPQKDELQAVAVKSGNKIFVHDFVQPEELARLYQNARVFCLPSLSEHWGLVVHEATLSGCMLLLSKTVGAADDLLTDVNGISFDPSSIDDMTIAFIKVMRASDEDIVRGAAESVRLSGLINFDGFVQGVSRLFQLHDR